MPVSKLEWRKNGVVVMAIDCILVEITYILDCNATDL